MSLKRINPGPRMSAAVILGDTVYLSGQVPNNLDGDITAQTTEVLEKIEAIMANLGGSKADVASAQVLLSDMAYFDGMNKVWEEWVGENPPARTTCAVALANPKIKVEVTVIARKP